MADSTAIVVDNVSKQFPGAARPAVDRCSFAVEQGQFIVLLGPSGCGKTTLLKMINRLYEPTGGRIMVGGTDVTKLPITDLRRHIGYVIQQTGLFPHMRIEANIAVVPRLLGWKADRIDARIDELLLLVGLPREYRARYPRQLSGGEQQRVGIARALAADPALMLMDEPFGAIDAITRTRLQGELLELQRKLQKTILFVTHDVEEALRLADKIIVMRDGHIVQFDTPLHVLTAPADAFVARLVDASDTLRQLSLIEVGAVASSNVRRLDRNGREARIDAGNDMRTALAEMLETGAEALTVVDSSGATIGRLTFDDIRGAVIRQPAAVSRQPSDIPLEPEAYL
jgi:osmoprotectant transport system ATP-binding protein